MSARVSTSARLSPSSIRRLGGSVAAVPPTNRVSRRGIGLAPHDASRSHQSISFTGRSDRRFGFSTRPGKHICARMISSACRRNGFGVQASGPRWMSRSGRLAFTVNPIPVGSRSASMRHPGRSRENTAVEEDSTLAAVAVRNSSKKRVAESDVIHPDVNRVSGRCVFVLRFCLRHSYLDRPP